MSTQKTTAQNLPYRRCVGIAVFNRQGLVWTGRRIDEARGESRPGFRWQMPQGGIDKHEEPLAAARRELREETSMRSVILIEEAQEWINYDLPDELIGVALKGKYRGQTQRWFAFRFEGNEDEIQVNPPRDGHKAEFDEWKWRPIFDVPPLIVPFKRRVYDKVAAAFGHIGAVDP
ncbi:MAG: RNA pyrophosphohydrolase [Pseudomonadota bacterium]